MLVVIHTIPPGLSRVVARVIMFEKLLNLLLSQSTGRWKLKFETEDDDRALGAL